MPDIFDVLADGTRRELLSTLRSRQVDPVGEHPGEMSVGELVVAMGLSQPTVSKHLKVLRDMKLVAVREQGQHRYYRLDDEPLVAVDEWLRTFFPPSQPEAEVEAESQGAEVDEGATRLGRGSRGLAERIGSAGGGAAHLFGRRLGGRSRRH